jgi:hypothetical protein
MRSRSALSIIPTLSKPLIARRKDVPDEPRGTPVLQRARQLGYLTGHDRQNVGLEVAALVEEGADRREVGRGVEIALTASSRRARRRGISSRISLRERSSVSKHGADVSKVGADFRLALEAWTRSMSVAARSAKCLRGRPPQRGGEF